MNWLALNYIEDNTEITKQLTGTYRSKDITPLNLIYDFEGNIYNFINGYFDDKMGEWKTTYVEFKAIRNIPDRPVKCDFADFDFNNDFCKTWSTQAARDYAKRVSDAGGIIDDKECLEASMLELMGK